MPKQTKKPTNKPTPTRRVLVKKTSSCHVAELYAGTPYSRNSKASTL